MDVRYIARGVSGLLKCLMSNEVLHRRRKSGGKNKSHCYCYEKIIPAESRPSFLCVCESFSGVRSMPVLESLDSVGANQ